MIATRQEQHAVRRAMGLYLDGSLTDNPTYYLGYLHGLGHSQEIDYHGAYQTLMWMVSLVNSRVDLEGGVHEQGCKEREVITNEEGEYWC